LSGENLTLYFPPPEEKAFYEGDDAPLQKIVARIHDLKHFQPHLKQDAKQLKLVARIKLSENQIERLDSIKQFIVFLNPFSFEERDRVRSS
jgi:hypothetical protein